MRVNAHAILSRQRIQRIQCKIVSVLFVLAHPLSKEVPPTSMWGQPPSAVRGAQLRDFLSPLKRFP